MPRPIPDPVSTTMPADHIDQGTLTQSVGYCCLQAYLEIVPNIKKQLGKLQLRPVEYTVLSLINSNPNINQKRLGQTIRVSPPNMATLLDKIQADGLIERRRNPNDRRSQILALTPKGHQLYLKAEAVATRADITPTLTDDERQQLLSLLTKIFQN
ncbi:MarR family winged helix-turn-helix transcriptional regulator [Pusillimonas sp. (ex Stolz et al. 2005)]|uniref:MarR family winged helix-turn-helix transcriptional regulator n=1 Tax=Pusillimonas sp. (ex Stolz et al. 2005) TaxID=1979962 RepID=UPI00262E8250|nr:MarR family winged helix-turn-helix transcriptional regulator [Pusillimonas sp. (ex Stolz et al. 2005)]